MNVIINGNVADVNQDNLPKAMSETYPKTISNIYYENYTGYQITNTDNILRARVGAEVGPTKYIGFIAIDYSFQDGEFKADKILFEEYPPKQFLKQIGNG